MLVHKKISQLVTLRKASQKKGQLLHKDDLDILTDATVVVDPQTQRIIWLGHTQDLPHEYQTLKFTTHVSETWLPCFTECHTHLVYGGHRYDEFALKTEGATYLEVAKAGGGILSTVKQTREASIEELLIKAKDDLKFFESQGVGIIEIKTGYGLDWKTEYKMLKVIQRLRQETPLQIVPTFLPAHAIPSEFQNKTEDYLKLICEEWIPQVAEEQLAHSVDIYIEKGYFSTHDAIKVFETCQKYNLKLKAHTNQFNNIGGIKTSLQYEPLSVDHLDVISNEDIQRLSESHTTAVLLPAATLYTKCPPPPARQLLDQGVAVALSTDYNPGSCPSKNLALVGTLGCTQLKMTLTEVIVATTYNAVKALGLEKNYGTFEKGKILRATVIKDKPLGYFPGSFGHFEATLLTSKEIS